jgi:hypothetical protein
MASITAHVQFVDRINPARFNFSPMLTAIVGGIIDHDYGVRDRKGGKLGLTRSYEPQGLNLTEQEQRK